MDAEVQNAAEQPPTQDAPIPPNDRQQGWRSWFRKNDPPIGDGDAPAGAAVDDADLDYYETSEPVAAADGQEQASEPAPSSEPPREPARTAGTRVSQPRAARVPLVSRPLINPRLRADPRLKVWISRVILCLIVYTVVTIAKDWRFGLSAAVIVAAADTVFRSRTTSITPTAVRVTSAQRATGRRLQVLKAAGYMTLHARRIPGSESVIDHVVIGPSGVFIVDSQRMDTRLPVRAIGGMLFHGPNPQTEKIDHARFEAQRAAALIGAELGQRVRVRPTMVIHGPNLPWVIMRLKGVDVFDGSHVSSYFRKQTKATVGHHLDSSQIALVFAAAAHALPPVG